MKTKKIYLCGPIMGCSDAEAMNWREMVKKLWPGICFDPMVRDYRGRESEPGIEVEIVEQDKVDIDKCHGVLVYYVRPSVGTSMEVYHSWLKRIPCVVVNASGGPISPWLRYHSTAIVEDITSAIARLSTLIK